VIDILVFSSCRKRAAPLGFACADDIPEGGDQGDADEAGKDGSGDAANTEDSGGDDVDGTDSEGGDPQDSGQSGTADTTSDPATESDSATASSVGSTSGEDSTTAGDSTTEVDPTRSDTGNATEGGIDTQTDSSSGEDSQGETSSTTSADSDTDSGDDGVSSAPNDTGVTTQNDTGVTTQNDTGVTTQNDDGAEETGIEATGGVTIGDDGGPVCEPRDELHVLHGTAPSVLFVLDKSGSMNTKWDHDANVDTATISRWNSLYQVVQNLVTAVANDLNVGALLFPKVGASTSGSGACALEASAPEVPVAPDNADALLAGIPPADTASLTGGTPTSAAITQSVEHLASMPAGSAKAIVLVTDGAANCKSGEIGENLNTVYDDTLPTVVADAYANQGISTYVVGIDIVDTVISLPTVNPHDALTDVAIAGGVPQDGPEKFYNANSQMELEAALDAISWAIECTITLDAEVSFPGVVTVEVNGTPIGHVSDCASEDGWVFTADVAPYNTIMLCGSACPAIGVTTEVDVHVECPAEDDTD